MWLKIRCLHYWASIPQKAAQKKCGFLVKMAGIYNPLFGL